MSAAATGEPPSPGSLKMIAVPSTAATAAEPLITSQRARYSAVSPNFAPCQVWGSAPASVGICLCERYTGIEFGLRRSTPRVARWHGVASAGRATCADGERARAVLVHGQAIRIRMGTPVRLAGLGRPAWILGADTRTSPPRRRTGHAAVSPHCRRGDTDPSRHLLLQGRACQVAVGRGVVTPPH